MDGRECGRIGPAWWPWSFDKAAPPAGARTIYEDLVAALRATGVTVRTGQFQAMMQVELVNDGPLTLLLDSRRGF